MLVHLFSAPCLIERMLLRNMKPLLTSTSSLSILLVTNDVVVVRKLFSQGLLTAVTYLARTKLPAHNRPKSFVQ